MGAAQSLRKAAKLLAWNIQHGGGTRLARIVEEISAYDPDVIALTEFRARLGVALCAAMKERGLPHLDTTHPAENQNGIAVFSRTPLRRTRPGPAPSAGLVRWLDIDLPEYGFGIGILHVMAAGSSKKHPTNVAKTRFWEVVLQAAESRLQEPFLFVCDWNTGGAPAGRNRQDVRMRGVLRQVVDVGLDGYVAASQPRNNGVYLVLETEGRRAR
jgi:exonuclease III